MKQFSTQNPNLSTRQNPTNVVILGTERSSVAEDPVFTSMQRSCILFVSLRDDIKNWILRNFAAQNSKDDESGWGYAKFEG